MPTPPVLLRVAVVAADEPAGGAPTEDLVPATIAALVLAVAVGGLLLGHRSGRITALARLGRFSERVSGLPPWASLPSAVVAVALVTAAFGF